MAETYGTFKARPRALVGDTRNPYAISSEKLQAITEMNMQAFGAEIGLGQKWLASPLTLVAGQGDYTLPAAGVEYGAILYMKRTQDGRQVTKLMPEELEQMFPGPLVATGQPLYFSAWQDDATVVNIRMRPIPTTVDTLPIFITQVPDALTSDAISIPFSRSMIQALAMQVAIDCIASLPAQEAARISVSKDVLATWERRIERAKSVEIEERNRRQRSANFQKADR